METRTLVKVLCEAKAFLLVARDRFAEPRYIAAILETRII